MQEKQIRPTQKLPAGTPWSGKKECPPAPSDPPVPNPTVPNRAHTEMRGDYPPELPARPNKKEV